MKPYELEIFDRWLNFRANALVVPEGLKYQRDLITSVTNTITLNNTHITIREPATAGSAGDQTVALSDYIRLKNYEDGYFFGYVTKLDREDNNLTITYMDLTGLFNFEVYINAVEITKTSLEQFLRDRLLEAFKNSDDSAQVIPGIEISIHTTTMGVFDFIDQDKPYVVINLLNDFIYPAFQKYLVKTTAYFDVINKKIVVDIGRMTTTVQRTIEADLPNIIDKNFIIRSSSNEINKLVIIDDSVTPYNSWTYYLHTDYTVDTSKSSNRKYPVINSVKPIDMATLAEHSYWTYSKAYVLSAAELIEQDGTLTTAEQNKLGNAVEFLKSYIHGNRYNQSTNYYYDFPRIWTDWLMSTKAPFAGQSYHWWDGSQSVNIYDDLMEQGEGYYYRKAEILTQGSNRGYDVLLNKGAEGYAFDVSGTIPSTTGTISESISGRFDKNCQYHAVVKQVIKIMLYITLYGNDGIPTVYTFYVTTWSGLPREEYEEAIDSYKQSAAYTSDINAYKAANLSQILSDYATSVFNTSKYKNLIEITTTADDGLAESLTYGRTVDIIHDGVTYKSILTGFTDLGNGLVKLTFGMIRLELTKILKMNGRG